jgi:hypothetical protein
LVEGEAVLVDAGLVERATDALVAAAELGEIVALADPEAARLVLLSLVGRRPPAWLPFAARENDPQEHLAADPDRSVLRSLEPDLASREALLLALGRRVDQRHNLELGASGEEHVVTRCRDELKLAGRGDLVGQVQRLSLWSDQLGYDIAAPRLDGSGRRIEVKTTAQDIGSGQAVIAISRNEAEVGSRDTTWALVLVNEQPGDECRVVGWCPAAAFYDLLPVDRGRVARWQQARVALNLAVLTPGLPPA